MVCEQGYTSIQAHCRKARAKKASGNKKAMNKRFVIKGDKITQARRKGLSKKAVAQINAGFMDAVKKKSDRQNKRVVFD
jgi:hypothetical protein